MASDPGMGMGMGPNRHVATGMGPNRHAASEPGMWHVIRACQGCSPRLLGALKEDVLGDRTHEERQ